MDTKRSCRPSGRLTLVVLAAGRSSRFGRPKTLEPVGPSGEVLFEYAICDAIRVGCERVVFVTWAEGAEPIMERAVARAGRAVTVDRVIQSLDGLPGALRPPAGRVKPWGTGHAVLALREEISTPFVVVNGDDFYGPRAVESFARRAASAIADGDDGHFLGAYALGRTGVSPSSGVNRGVLAAGVDGTLQGIDEVYDIRLTDAGFLGRDGSGVARALRSDVACTMNLWAFQPSIFDWLEDRFEAFLSGLGAACADPPTPPAPALPAGRRPRQHSPATGKSGRLLIDEFLLSETVGDLAKEGAVRVRLVEMSHDTTGLTHADDLPSVAATLRRAVEGGACPADLGRWFERRARVDPAPAPMRETSGERCV